MADAEAPTLEADPAENITDEDDSALGLVRQPFCVQSESFILSNLTTNVWHCLESERFLDVAEIQRAGVSEGKWTDIPCFELWEYVPSPELPQIC